MRMQVHPAKEKENESPHAAQEELRRRLSQFEKKLKLLRQTLDRLDLVLDSLEMELLELQQTYLPLPEPAPARRGYRRNVKRCGDATTPSTPAVAFAKDIQFVRRGDGGATVCIDGGTWFTLQPMPASLLAALLSAHQSDKPDTGRWKSYEFIANEIGESLVDKRVRHRISQLVYLLRNVLQKHGASPDLIETDRRMGARFRLNGAHDASIWNPPNVIPGGHAL